MGRILLTALKSGSGKTLISCGLMQAFKNMGMSVNAYKCGPDYIDPMFHKSVLKIPSENLDSFFSDKEELCGILARGKDFDISIIEGVMGIYDGLGGISSEGSAYDIACKTESPIILILDVHGMGRSMISMIKGILADDKHKLIKGIFLNRISAGYYETIKPVIEEETGVPVVAYLKKLPEVNIDSRHLGLKLPGEIEDLHSQINQIAGQMEVSVNFDKIIEIADSAGELTGRGSHGNSSIDIKISSEIDGNLQEEVKENKRIRLAVAYDEVFCFYYEENLRQLSEAGAELVYFSPVHDSILPKDISGILLGGGYPELRLKELSENTSMRNSIKEAIQNGMPSIAECGGFMYLHDSISDGNSEYEMLGLIPGNCFNTGKLCRFGYVDIVAGKYRVKGHEFHYYDSTAKGCDGIAKKPINNNEWQFGYIDEKRFWGFPHLYYASCKEIPRDFINAMKEYRNRKE